MDKKSLKLDLVQKLLLSEDNDVLEKIGKLLDTSNRFKLSAAQKKELDERKKRHESGKSASYTWNEVKQRARQGMKK